MAKQPGSWWLTVGETWPSKRHDKVPLGGEQLCGPQHQAKSAAAQQLHQADVSGGIAGARLAARIHWSAVALGVRDADDQLPGRDRHPHVGHRRVRGVPQQPSPATGSISMRAAAEPNGSASD
ncbi:hypothetical protein [Streptomyces brasiliensis]|uniref:Uncharacterized protein n=1 Tax=Streptomyces brasiliensis TaxID=1954 RepID=A0A917ULM8_9ACTN|nr:hypothetical protein [Streptomyces brasiliensis]GGJ67043.1 hypothetical protein GCM10010121_092200 [Streptomyces brasiliensis]